MEKVYVLTEYQNDGGWIMSHIIGVFKNEYGAKQRMIELEKEMGEGYYCPGELWLEIEAYNVR